MRFILLFLMSISLFACVDRVDLFPKPEEAETTFQELLKESINNSYDQIPGVSMTVIAPELNIDWTGAEGFDSKDKDQKLTADQPFRIASITKTYVAAAILRLHEMNQLSIEDPIEKHISAKHRALLLEGGYAPDSITIGHCLNHTSGLFDYALGNQTYSEIAKANPQKRWTRTQQIEHAMKVGTRVGYPGEKYRYGDTGYVLLGEIIELKMDSTLGYGLKTLLKFDQLQLKSTWLESIDPEPAGLKDPVHRYFRGLEALNWDPSIDLYGGGGLVSTTRELAIFMQALFNHQIFDQKSTLDLMLKKPTYDPAYDTEADRRFKDYRQGLWMHTVFNRSIFIHQGLWGSQMIHIPELNASIAINYTKGSRERLAKRTIHVLHHLTKIKQIGGH